MQQPTPATGPKESRDRPSAGVRAWYITAAVITALGLITGIVFATKTVAIYRQLGSSYEDPFAKKSLAEQWAKIQSVAPSDQLLSANWNEVGGGRLTAVYISNGRQLTVSGDAGTVQDLSENETGISATVAAARMDAFVQQSEAWTCDGEDEPETALNVLPAGTSAFIFSCRDADLNLTPKKMDINGEQITPIFQGLEGLPTAAKVAQAGFGDSFGLLEGAYFATSGEPMTFTVYGVTPQCTAMIQLGVTSFSGDALPLCKPGAKLPQVTSAATLTTEAVTKALETGAAALGRPADKTHFYVHALNGDWVLKAEGEAFEEKWVSSQGAIIPRPI